MLSQKMTKAIAISGAVATGALLLGILKVFDLSTETNLFNTGITSSMIFGAWSLAVAFLIYKNRV